MKHLSHYPFAEVALAVAYPYAFGDWFCLPESDVVVESGPLAGTPFAPGKADMGLGGRRVIIANRKRGPVVRPSVRVYPRNSDELGHHDPHSDCEPSCRIDLPGRVRREIPYTVKASSLVMAHWSCAETNDDLLSYVSRGTV